MRALHRLLKLHLVSKQNKISSATGHRHNIGKGNLPRFINEEEIKNALPLWPREEPSRTSHDATVICCPPIGVILHVSQRGIVIEQLSVSITSNFNSY